MNPEQMNMVDRAVAQCVRNARINGMSEAEVRAIEKHRREVATRLVKTYGSSASGIINRDMPQ